MIRVALIEDDGEARERMREYLARFSSEENIEYSLECFEDPVLFLDAYHKNYDIVMLDIELPNMDGMTCAHRLREKDMDVTIIFVTNMAQYAIKGYEVDAADFIVKPVSYFDFALKLRRITQKQKNKEEFVSIGADLTEKRIPVKDLYYVELVGHNLVYHTAEGDFEIRGTIKKADAELEKYGFFRCSNYCIVNLRYVQSIKGYFLKITRGTGGKAEELAISQLRKKEFIQVLKTFLQEDM